MKISNLFIDDCLTVDREIQYLIDHLNVPPVVVHDAKQIYERINAALDPVSEGKKTLYITRNKGNVIRECPGTSVYTCCDYTILHCGTFCSMDCSYCILQSYFHPPVLQYFAGLDLLGHALEKVFNTDKIYRIGTGEFTDSLIWEPISLMPAYLVETFSKQHNCILELKTKTVNVESLLNLDHNGKTIIAWSMNTPQIISSQEKGTASLTARLKAAKKVARKGYKLAFHFDPLVIYPGCIEAYKKVIRQIFDTVDAKDIVWISLGTFRFMPGLKAIVEKRFKDSTICYGEFILGLDNKMRYFKPLRIELYKALADYLRKVAPEVFVYFCMEDKEVWQKTFGYFPDSEGELGHLLDQSAVKHCGLKVSRR